MTSDKKPDKMETRNPFYGKKHTEETKKKMSQAQKWLFEDKDYYTGGSLPCQVEKKFYSNFKVGGERNGVNDKSTAARWMYNRSFPEWIPLPKGTTEEEWKLMTEAQLLFFKEEANLIGDEKKKIAAEKAKERRAKEKKKEEK